MSSLRWRCVLVLGAWAAIDGCGDRRPLARAGDDAPGRRPAFQHFPDEAFHAELRSATLLGWIAEPGAMAEGVPLSTWLDRLGSRDLAERDTAQAVFRRMGRDSLPWLAVGLGSAEGMQRVDVCADLAGELMGAAGAEPLAATTDPRPWMRRVAWAAGRRGALPEVERREALGDDDRVVRREAAIGFVRTPATLPATLGALEAALASEEFGERAAAALALLRAGGPAGDRVTRSLERPETRKRLAATWLLVAPIEAWEAMLPLLASMSWPVRSHGVTSLAVARSIPEPAVSALVKALEDSSGDVRWRAACALDRVEARGSEGALRGRLTDPVPDVRTAAAVALSSLGSIDEAAVMPLVTGLLGSAAPSELRDFFGFYESQAGPRWYLLIGTPMPGDRIASALGRHGATGVAALRGAAREEGAHGRRLAVMAYEAAGEHGTSALFECLADADGPVRRTAALGLARREMYASKWWRRCRGSTRTS